MKKSVALITTIIIIMCISLCACSNKENQPQTSTQAAAQNESQRQTEIATNEPKADNEKGTMLKNTVSAELGTDTGAELTGDFATGCFTYKFSRDAQIMYAKERDDSVEAVAKENAQSLVDEISGFYDGEITLDTFEAKQIGSGDNGIDSVQYRFSYVNSQNQKLVIYADSDGVISYADCTFTW